MVRTFWWCVAGFVACTSTGRVSESCNAAIVAADPLWGGGGRLAERLALDGKWFARGDSQSRETRLRELLRECDVAAARLVAELVPAGPDAAVLAFWRSDAGNALAAGEVLALAGSWQDDGFPAEFAAIASDPQRVGVAARQGWLDVQAAWAAGSSPSPSAVALLLGATRIPAEHAGVIATFYASEAGQRWLRLRTLAWQRSCKRFYAVTGDLADRGLLGSVFDGMDLQLPRATCEPTGADR